MNTTKGKSSEREDSNIAVASSEESGPMDKTESMLSPNDGSEEDDDLESGSTSAGASSDKSPSLNDEPDIPIIKRKPPSWV